jgi:hypothetical protein
MSTIVFNFREETDGFVNRLAKDVLASINMIILIRPRGMHSICRSGGMHQTAAHAWDCSTSGSSNLNILRTHFSQIRKLKVSQEKMHVAIFMHFMSDFGSCQC